MAHIETMVSFGRKKISMINTKNFLGIRMQEKHLERLGFEPTTVLEYSCHKVPSQAILGDRTGQSSIDT